MSGPSPHDSISATEPDWSREAKPFWDWSPGRSLLASIRSYQRHRGSRHPVHVALRMMATARHRFWSAMTGADIPVNCQLGGGLALPHPNGVVIHPGARIGPNCLIFQQVTIGTRDDGLPPTVGGHVDIGAGARVLGSIVIGNHARIGANAVVLDDVPAHASAVGIPARVLEARAPREP